MTMESSVDDLGLSAVLFDMDGTLVDSEPLWDVSLHDLARMLGGKLTPQTRQRVMGSNLIETVQIVQTDLGVIADESQSARWLLRRTKELFAGGVPWQPGAEELVRAVRANGIPTALVTSSYRELTDVVLSQWPSGLFDVVVCADEVARPKPDPEPYLTAASMLAVDPCRCVALEDSPRGMTAALVAGCSVVAITADPLEATLAPSLVIPGLEELSVERLAGLIADESRVGGSMTTRLPSRTLDRG